MEKETQTKAGLSILNIYTMDEDVQILKEMSSQKEVVNNSLVIHFII